MENFVENICFVLNYKIKVIDSLLIEMICLTLTLLNNHYWQFGENFHRYIYTMKVKFVCVCMYTCILFLVLFIFIVLVFERGSCITSLSMSPSSFLLYTPGSGNPDVHHNTKSPLFIYLNRSLYEAWLIKFIIINKNYKNL